MNSNKNNKFPKKNGNRPNPLAQKASSNKAAAQPVVARNPVPRQQRRAESRAAARSVGRTAYVPAAVATGTQSMQPRISGDRNQTRIVHRELVASITGSSSFAVAQTLALNPGLAASFPWLASQAQGWEEYRFNRLKFCYYTRTGSSTPGSVQLAPDYDAADAPPATEQIASSFEDVVEDAPWKDLECVLNPNSMFPMGPKKFIRSGSLAANLDIKTYDAGQLFICTTDGTAVNWGKLWVEYDVSFFVPANAASGSIPASSQHVTSVTPSSSEILPIPVTLSGSSNLVSILGNVLTFLEAGRFLVTLRTTATTLGGLTPVAVAAGGALVPTFGTAGRQVAGDDGTTKYMQSCLLDAVVGTTLTYAIVVTAGGATAELLVARVPPLQT